MNAILPGTALPIGLAEEGELGDAVPAADERQRYRGFLLSDGVTADGTDDKWCGGAPSRMQATAKENRGTACERGERRDMMTTER